MSTERVYFAVRRGGKWVAKRAEDAAIEDLQGINFGRDFMSAVVASDDADAAVIQVETNLRAGEDPFEALRSAGSSSAGLELIRKVVREAGYRVTMI